MRFLERLNHDRTRQDPSGSEPGGALDEIRNQAQHFLDAGDNAINRALAGSDSEAFLKAGRQQSGQ